MPPPIFRPTLRSAARASVIDEKERQERVHAEAQNDRKSTQAKVFGTTVSRNESKPQSSYALQKEREDIPEDRGKSRGVVGRLSETGIRYNVKDGKKYDHGKYRDVSGQSSSATRDSSSTGILPKSLKSGGIKDADVVRNKQGSSGASSATVINSRPKRLSFGHEKYNNDDRDCDPEKDRDDSGRSSGATGATSSTGILPMSLKLEIKNLDLDNDREVTRKLQNTHLPYQQTQKKIFSASITENPTPSIFLTEGVFGEGLMILCCFTDLGVGGEILPRQLGLLQKQNLFETSTGLKWKGNYDKLERNHQYMQWLFPIPESSGSNLYAQQLYEHEANAIRDDDAAHKRVLAAFKMMLDFYGMQLVSSIHGTLKRSSKGWEDRYNYLNRSRHNYLQITRILKSIGELGYEKLQAPWVEFLIEEALTKKELPNLNGPWLMHWIIVVKDDGERERLYLKASGLHINQDNATSSINSESEEENEQKPAEKLHQGNDNLKFYQNNLHSRPSPGFTIETMLTFKGQYTFFEDYPGFIHWLFPVPETTGKNTEAQPLYEHEAEAIRNDDELISRVREAFNVILDFYGMCIYDDINGKFRRNRKTYKDRYDYLQRYKENYFRITRIIISIGELGLERLQVPWIDFLISEGIDCAMFPTLDGQCIKHWISAITDDGEKHAMFRKYHRLAGHKALVPFTQGENSKDDVEVHNDIYWT